jgi:hypothetical protein
MFRRSRAASSAINHAVADVREQPERLVDVWSLSGEPAC